MIRLSVWHGGLTDSYLKRVTQLGAECFDFGGAGDFPGMKEQGYPDLDEVIKIRKRIRSWGLDINRVTLPDITEAFMQDRPGGEVELENTCNAMKVFGEAGVPIVRQRFAGDTFNEQLVRFRAPHRGGYLSRSESLELNRDRPDTPDQEALERWWERFCAVYAELVPLAEEYDLKLALHPSDTPLPDTPFGGLGYHRVIDAFPSRNVGYLYCCGTRAEAGGTPLILDEINNYGRKGRIFTVHFRNVRGSLATARGFEEVLLDDGDMNMFKVLLELQKVGFDGCVNPDHIPPIEGDSEGPSHGLAYSIGYIRALLAAIAALP
ncbi:MAG: mannonate dehydratase [Candidatus Latescibacteria bacterium]|jgi:mannonate dehydratase|nr:mannonate dehydratase [Candidatus Latescibacterota bacterium]